METPQTPLIVLLIIRTATPLTPLLHICTSRGSPQWHAAVASDAPELPRKRPVRRRTTLARLRFVVRQAHSPGVE